MNINGFTGNGAMKSRLMIVSVEDICATAPLTLVPFFQNMEYTLGAQDTVQPFILDDIYNTIENIDCGDAEIIFYDQNEQELNSNYFSTSS